MLQLQLFVNPFLNITCSFIEPLNLIPLVPLLDVMILFVVNKLNKLKMLINNLRS